MPPNGQNFYYVDDKEIDRSLGAVDSSLNEADRLKAYHDFEKRWYDIQPMTILFYPQDLVAVNPKLSGFDATTYTPTFYPQPETLDDRRRRGRCHGSLRLVAAAKLAHPDVLHRLQRIRTSSAPPTTASTNTRAGKTRLSSPRSPAATPCPTTASTGW